MTRTEIAPALLAYEAIENLHEGCQVIGFDFSYLYVNDAVLAQARVTREALLGRTMMEAFPGIQTTPLFATLRECMENRVHLRMENEFTDLTGQKGIFELRFVPVSKGVCILSLDVTEAKRTATALARSEEQVRQMQRMEAVSRLAGGVAHDFNNILSVILSYTNLLAMDIGPDDTRRSALDEIKRASERATALTRQLLTFSQGETVVARVIDLNSVVRGIEEMVRRLVSENITIRTALAEFLWRVKIDPSQLEQVLLNLVVNARDAMANGGTLTIETQNIAADPTRSIAQHGVGPKAHVVLSVSDTGVGMDKQTQGQIFEPFFTTKSKGKGTGLGLTTVFGIVRQAGGTISVYSEPGRGSTFKVYLPRTEEAELQVAAPIPALPAPAKGSEIVMLVEDDDQLRRAAARILRRGNYQVLEAASGKAALSECMRPDLRIDLLLTDLVMPQMGGRELVEHVQKIRPELPVIYMSGYSEDALPKSELQQARRSMLQKPITPDALLRKVAEALDH